jgi:DNA-binding transcriptional LysR family regulator
MTLQQLTYFLAAAEHGSFSRAARALYLAQPSLSEQVRALESELGVALFVRAGRGVVLTEAGRAFRPEAERVLAALATAREAVVDVRELRGGTLSFGMFGTASGFLLSRLVADFRLQHPTVSLRLVGQNSSEVAEDVRRGRLEAALVVLPVDDEGLEVRPARREEVVYISREPERVREPITIERLAASPLILYDAQFGWSDPTRRQLQERAQQAGVQLKPVIEIEDMEAALELVASGLGDTVAPRAALTHRRRFRSLGSVSFAEPLYDTFAFIARRGAPVSPAARAFLELAERRLAEFGEGVLYAGITGGAEG